MRVRQSKCSDEFRADALKCWISGWAATCAAKPLRWASAASALDGLPPSGRCSAQGACAPPVPPSVDLLLLRKRLRSRGGTAHSEFNCVAIENLRRAQRPDSSLMALNRRLNSGLLSYFVDQFTQASAAPPKSIWEQLAPSAPSLPATTPFPTPRPPVPAVPAVVVVPCSVGAVPVKTRAALCPPRPPPPPPPFPPSPPSPPGHALLDPFTPFPRAPPSPPVAPGWKLPPAPP